MCCVVSVLFLSDLVVLETPPGQRAERFSAPCELPVRLRMPIENEPGMEDVYGLLVYSTIPENETRLLED